VTQRDRIVVSVFGLIAVLAAAWFVMLKPKREEATRLAEQVSAAEGRRDAAQSRLGGAQAARGNYREAYASLARLGKAVPADDDTASVLYQLSRTSRRVALDLESLNVQAGPATPAAAAPSGGSAAATAPPGTSPGPGGLLQLPFKLTLEGEFGDMRELLDRVGRYTRVFRDEQGRVRVRGRLLTLDGVSIAPSEGGLLSLRMLANAYVAPAPRRPTDTPAAGTPGSQSASTATSTPPAATSGGPVR